MSLVEHLQRIHRDFRGRLIVPHQSRAVTWMLRRELTDGPAKGGILADSMGVGKTIELLATLIGNPVENGTLIVVPKSLLPQWVDAIRRFVGLDPLVVTCKDLRARQRAEIAERLNTASLVVVPYGVLCMRRTQDQPVNCVLQKQFGRAVLDEGYVFCSFFNYSSRWLMISRFLRADIPSKTTGRCSMLERNPFALRSGGS